MKFYLSSISTMLDSKISWKRVNAIIAPYKRAIKTDDTGLTITILFPLDDIPITMFLLLHDQPVIINDQEFYRIH